LHLQSSAHPLEPYLQSVLLQLFWKWGLANNFSKLNLAVILMCLPST
jgi:hypothetical protein